MKKLFTLTIISAFLAIRTTAQEKLIYHDIRTDKNGQILPWYNDDPGESYSHVVKLVWGFWENMRMDPNGIPYYMNHQVWYPDYNDIRGLGGDQLMMAMSAWQLLYAYTGNEKVKQNMTFMADYYLSHGMSPANAAWANLPFPYNTLVYSGTYDGDMILGKNYLQPDKAGSLGIELVKLYKMLSYERHPHIGIYLQSAIEIANTLAQKVKPGDQENSPLPFKVNAFTGEVGKLKNPKDRSDIGLSSYTTNWSGMMELWLELIQLKEGNTELYKQSFETVLSWMKKYPMQTNKWGPFFEDIAGWSDTQINAMTWARFIMNHPQYFPQWKTDVQKIIDWVYKTLGNEKWKKYGITVINEQTAYRVPGNSHTSRQAADELLFASLTNDFSRKEHAVRQLNWATYMVDNDGKNRYPLNENWLTDGYGDYARHYLRAMAAIPELAPNEDHILSSSSIVQLVGYAGQSDNFQLPSDAVKPEQVVVYYRTFDNAGQETIRLKAKPSSILLGDKALQESQDKSKEGYKWQPLKDGGLLWITRLNGSRVTILK